jgi:hypothetical protein
MEMVIAWTSITGVSHISNDIPLLYVVSLSNALGIPLEVGVIENKLLLVAQLIDRSATPLAMEQFNNFTVGRCEDRSAGGRGDIDCIVHSTF